MFQIMNGFGIDAMGINQSIGCNMTLFHGIPQWFVAYHAAVPFFCIMMFSLSPGNLLMNILKKVSITCLLQGNDNFQYSFFHIIAALMKFLQNCSFQCRGGAVIFFCQYIINSYSESVADIDKRGKRNLHPVVFDVADMTGIYIGIIGDKFLCHAFGNTNFPDFLADLFKVDFLHVK